MERVILKTVAALLNSQGGTLLIGVNDDGDVVGLNRDYQTFSKSNKRDACELFLTNDLLLKNLGKDLAPCLRITFHEVANRDVCKIAIQPAPRPVYLRLKNSKTGQLEECLFIRTGNSTNKLDTPEAIVNYSKVRWP